jgi:hypothetical protein
MQSSMRLDKSFSLYFALNKEESRETYDALPNSFKTRITKANTYEGYGLANIPAKCDFRCPSYPMVKTFMKPSLPVLLRKKRQMTNS